MEDLNLTDQKRKIVRETGTFLKQECGSPAESIGLMMENVMILIRVANFLCPAEQKIGFEKQDTDLIHQMYAKIFDVVKGPFIDRINRTAGRKVISSQVGINFETKSFLMIFF